MDPGIRAQQSLSMVLTDVIGVPGHSPKSWEIQVHTERTFIAWSRGREGALLQGASPAGPGVRLRAAEPSGYF